MLGIFAQSLMIATRTDGLVLMRDVPPTPEPPRKTRYFWQRPKWREIDPNKL
jgi:hypothetical protein